MPVTESEHIRILIADDHDRFRQALRQFLERQAGIEVVGSAHDGEEALALVARVRPDVLLLDMRMSRMGGAEVIQRLRQSGAAVRVLVLSAHDDAAHRRKAMAAGADGYLLKADGRSHLVPAIEGVSRGEKGQLCRQREQPRNT